MWYGDMAKCIVNHFLEADPCLGAGLCYEKSAMTKGVIQNKDLKMTIDFCHNLFSLKSQNTFLTLYPLQDEGLDLRGVHPAYVRSG